MNKMIMMGRLTRDVELRYARGTNQTAIGRYTLAVNRTYRREGEPTADFITCVAFGNRAEFASKYFKKGMQVVVIGELRLNTYEDKDKIKKLSAEVIVGEQYFAESRGQSEERRQQETLVEEPTGEDEGQSFDQIDDSLAETEGLPF